MFKPSLNLASLTLRASLAFSFFYAAIASLISPLVWVGWLPKFLLDIVPFSPEITLMIFSFFEIILGLWLLSNWKLVWAARISVLVLLAIVIFNLNNLVIVFRDISLAGAALALVFLSKL